MKDKTVHPMWKAANSEGKARARYLEKNKLCATPIYILEKDKEKLKKISSDLSIPMWSAFSAIIKEKTGEEQGKEKINRRKRLMNDFNDLVYVIQLHDDNKGNISISKEVLIETLRCLEISLKEVAVENIELNFIFKLNQIPN